MKWICINCMKKHGNPHDVIERYISGWGKCGECGAIRDLYPLKEEKKKEIVKVG